MTMFVRAGVRLRSSTCSTEVIVLTGSGEFDLRCGGESMVPMGTEVLMATPCPPFDRGTSMGKRYASDDGVLEVLCIKAGDGSLSIGDAPIAANAPKPLPATD